MKKILLTLSLILSMTMAFADSVLIEGFEYANHDLTPPIGWNCDDNSWLCGYQPKDHNRIPHTGNWYAFTDTDDAWMFMELYMGHDLKYRYYYWAISDGEYDVEVWAGSGPSTEQMTQLLFTKTVNSGEYEQFSEYIENLSTDYEYFGIHAIAHEGAHYLTIDDVYIDMVVKYAIASTPYNADTILYPGGQTNYTFSVQNLGYEPFEVIIQPSHEYFTDFHFYVEGNQCTMFHLEPNESKKVTAVATLKPDIQAGASVWLDIMLVLDCDCATSMTTLWVTVVEPTGLTEQENPNEVLQVEWFDLTGKKVDPANLKAGVYIKRTTTDKGITTRKIIRH